MRSGLLALLRGLDPQRVYASFDLRPCVLATLLPAVFIPRDSNVRGFQLWLSVCCSTEHLDLRIPSALGPRFRHCRRLVTLSCYLWPCPIGASSFRGSRARHGANAPGRHAARREPFPCLFCEVTNGVGSHLFFSARTRRQARWSDGGHRSPFPPDRRILLRPSRRPIVDAPT